MKNYFAPGCTYNDHHKEMTVNASSVNVSELVRSFFAEDITPEPAKKNNPACEDIEQAETVAMPPKFFCVSEKFTEQNIRDRLAADLAQSTTKIEYCRALYRLQHIGCIDIAQYASDAKRAAVFNQFQSKFNLAPNDFCRARSSK